jgi:NAD-reducing hydrogenase large subunit
MQTITIDAVTRVEGHGKVTLQLDDHGLVQDAHLHITQFRGFEKFTEGRPFYEMPAITARVCGICPVSHLIASAKACDAILAVRIPETAEKLRRIIHLAQFVQSHALSFFHLSSPDFLLGMDGDPAQRNVFGVIQKDPQLARAGIRLRQWGQEIIELLCGRRIHGAWLVPGGVSEPLSVEKRDKILAGLPEARATAMQALRLFKGILGQFREEIRTFANFPTLFMALARADGKLCLYGSRAHSAAEGWLRFADGDGKTVADHIQPEFYQDYIGEAVEPMSYMKAPYFKPMGFPAGIYRVGPMARLNLAQHCGTDLADQELAEFRDLEPRIKLSWFYNHYARLIELLFGIERIERLLNEPDILDSNVRAHAGVNATEGVGIIEAPRGTLIHHYKVNEQGLITWANLIVATAHNTLAMNRGLLQVARHFIAPGRPVSEGMLNRVQAVIRAFDPCLSCATHADGSLALAVEVYRADGSLQQRIER